MINIYQGEKWNRCHSCGAPSGRIITIRNNINPIGGTSIQLCEDCLKDLRDRINVECRRCNEKSC